jgi:carboxypeptidase family protein
MTHRVGSFSSLLFPPQSSVPGRLVVRARPLTRLKPGFGVTPLWRTVLSCLLLMLLVAAALGQDASTGAIRGTVTDSSGGRVEWASVVVVNSGTGLRYSTASDSAGRFA